MIFWTIRVSAGSRAPGVTRLRESEHDGNAENRPKKGRSSPYPSSVASPKHAGIFLAVVVPAVLARPNCYPAPITRRHVTTPPAPTTPDVFHFEDGRQSFEDLGQPNGHRWWWWSDLAVMLGYSSSKAAQKAFDRAMTACNSLGITIHENFTSAQRTDAKGYTVQDFKLSRFACYLIAMNADPRKAEVAKAQAYFATVAQAAQAAEEVAGAVERVAIRTDVTDGEKALHSAAKHAGVTDYGYFQNAGYRGLYNMNLNQLRQRKGIPGNRTPLDFMGRTELAANLFRITQTEEVIKTRGVRGQRALEQTAHNVGQSVRGLMQKTGTLPEQLPAEEDIKTVKSGIKRSQRTLQRVDDPPKRLPRPKAPPAAPPSGTADSSE